jgi:MYXO-CTERM domain-containing protein
MREKFLIFIRSSYAISVSAIVGVLCFVTGARAGVFYNFEPPTYTGSPTGTTVNGQNGWTTPTGNASVYTYSSNALGFPTNSNGGTQFLGATSPDSNTVDRARQSLDLSSSNLWQFNYDIVASVVGTADNTNIFNFANLPILDNGSGSATGGVFMGQLLIWDSSTSNSTFTYELEGATSSNDATFFATPGGTSSAFNHLQQNHWYTIGLTLDLANNTVVSESIRDITAGGPTNTYGTPTNFFFDGGQGGHLGITQFGLTALGGLTNSTDEVGVDNISFTSAAVPEAPTWLMPVLGVVGAVLARRRR